MITAKDRWNGRDIPFQSLGALLRHIAHSCNPGGHHRKVEDWYLPRPHSHGAYWFAQDTGLRLDDDTYARLYQLHQRYRAFCRHMREVDPEWEETKRIPYMDNSVEVIETSRKYGTTRTRQIVAPHGDACF